MFWLLLCGHGLGQYYGEGNDMDLTVECLIITFVQRSVYWDYMIIHKLLFSAIPTSFLQPCEDKDIIQMKC